jgi:hypothetical protein
MSPNSEGGREALISLIRVIEAILNISLIARGGGRP